MIDASMAVQNLGIPAEVPRGFLEALLAALPHAGAIACLGFLSLARGFGWGPGIHIRLARGLLDWIRGRRARTRDEEIVLANSEAFLYGNIAADIVNFKNYGGIKNHCHNWNIHERLEAHARDDRERAFILGYLCHLSADLVAHNQFIPYHLVQGLPPRILAHAYWEALADADVADEDWDVLAALRRDRSLTRHDRLVWSAVRRRALGKRSNKWIFHHVLLLNLRPSWRELIRSARARRSRHPIDSQFFRGCLERSLKNMQGVFLPDRLPLLKLQDPTGRASLRGARALRREIIRAHGAAAEGQRISRRLALEAFGGAGASGSHRPPVR